MEQTSSSSAPPQQATAARYSASDEAKPTGGADV